MKRVLFVDDEANVVAALERMLHAQRAEWEMTFVSSGPAALERLAAVPHDVIVTDMHMPGMDGGTLLARVQERYPGVVRIVLSGHSELEAAMRAVPVAHQFLAKPCDAGTLREVVRRACELQTLLADETLRELIGRVDALPSLPRIYHALTRAVGDPNVQMRDVAAIVEQDVGMCAKVLQLVNSAFFGLPRRVLNIQSALGLLGMSMLKDLVLSLEVFRTFHAGKTLPGFSAERLQRHTLLAAGVARRLLHDPRESEDAFMAAMLHDVGQLVLVTRLPDRFTRALALSRAEGRPLGAAEEEQFGVTHAEIGAYLLGLWGLPYPVLEAVAHHHAPARVLQERFGVLGAVHVADALAHEVSPEDDLRHDLIDHAYLRALGVEALLPEWRAIAAEQAGSAHAA